MNEYQIKHIEMIQAVITRMASNSFMMKGWSVTLISALVALAAKDSNQKFVIIAFLPAICFWGLDAYYLRQERLFRKLYDAVISEEINIPQFSMDTSPVSKDVDSWFKTLCAKVIFFYHGPVVVAIAIVLFLI